MDAQFWIYIVIGVIYFLSRMLKKPEQVPGESTDRQTPEKRRPVHTEQPPTEKPRPLTFEDLLREITEGKQVQRPEPVQEKESRYEPYEQALGDEARSLEEVTIDEAETASKWKPYEVVDQKPLERKSLEETLRLEDTIIDFRKFEAFQSQTKRNVLNDYIRIIRNPESLRQAVVMSEILKRKF